MGKKDWIRTLSRIAFAIYMFILVYFLLLSDGFGRTIPHDRIHYNLIPFVEIMRFIKYRETIGFFNVMINLVGNVMAFIPFGALIRWVINRSVRWYHVTGYTFLFSLSVELLQLVAKVGSFDVDDLFLNTLGGLIGFWVYYVLRWIDYKHDKRRKEREKEHD